MLFRFIDSGKGDPFINMAIDEALSIFIKEGKSLPTIRFYEWDKPALSIGEFQKIGEVNHYFCNLHNIPIVRRPTGGKGILHYCDLTYSISSKKENLFKSSIFKTYETISEIFISAFRLYGISVESKREKRTINRSSFCFARSTFGEICYGNIKILGSAQKRWKESFLQQGTMPIFVNKLLLKEIFFLRDFDLSTIRGIKEIFSDFDIEEFKRIFKISLNKVGIKIIEESLKDEELSLALELLEEKYQNPHWIYR